MRECSKAETPMEYSVELFYQMCGNVNVDFRDATMGKPKKMQIVKVIQVPGIVG